MSASQLSRGKPAYPVLHMLELFDDDSRWRRGGSRCMQGEMIGGRTCRAGRKAMARWRP